MEKIKFSIIVPVYNASTYLADAIESVICQSYKEWELLLIDDGSTDDSKSICEQYQKRDFKTQSVETNNPLWQKYYCYCVRNLTVIYLNYTLK